MRKFLFIAILFFSGSASAVVSYQGHHWENGTPIEYPWSSFPMCASPFFKANTQELADACTRASFLVPVPYPASQVCTKDWYQYQGVDRVEGNRIYLKLRVHWLSNFSNNVCTYTDTDYNSMYISFGGESEPIPCGSPNVMRPDGTCGLPYVDDAWCESNTKKTELQAASASPTSLCAQVDASTGRDGGCGYTPLSGMNTPTGWYGEAVPTGQACDSPTTVTRAATTESTATEACATGADGTEVCVSTSDYQNAQGQNCGTINGEGVCIESLPQNTCVSTDSGAIVCTGSAVPTSPTGETKTPTTTVTQQNSTGGQSSATYYNTNNTTTNNSTTATTTTNPDGTTTTTTDVSAITQKLDELEKSQCGGPLQPKCQMEDTTEGTAGGYGGETMPAQSSETMYTTRYPDGLSAVWSSKRAAIQESAFVSSVSENFGLGISGSGTYPVWTMDLNLGPKLGNFGTFDLSLPGWLWDILGAIVLVTAAFTCRRIIFGG